MAFDNIEHIGSSLIQHGKNSDRVYLMKLAPGEAELVSSHMLELSRIHGYTKLFAKLPVDEVEVFTERGFEEEARIPGLFRGCTDGVFCSLFTDPNRKIIDAPERRQISEIVELSHSFAKDVPEKRPEPEELRQLRAKDMNSLSALYRKVFASYPFPIHDPEYLMETLMSDAVNYFGVFEEGLLVAASSAEMDHPGMNTEMTDFATLPGCRGRGYAQALLGLMELETRRREHLCLYTIARAMSPGMNITFARRGYHFAGTLVRNTDISGAIESMNVWYLGESGEKTPRS